MRISEYHRKQNLCSKCMEAQNSEFTTVLELEIWPSLAQKTIAQNHKDNELEV